MGGVHDLGAGVRDGGAARFGDQPDFRAFPDRLQPRFDLAVVDLVGQCVDGNFLQRPCGADQLQEGARCLGVLGDVGVQPSGQRAHVGGQPALGRGLSQTDGDQVQGAAAHSEAPGASSGSRPNRVSMRVNSISGSPMMAVGSSLWMLSIRAMPRLSALALPAVS
ncbi:hypothetical protein G6F22_017034 [Rhizopus arrhizus]|nr:hypothetical protein G6F22_017034 [Rhizopus arrhizus]